jgi:hypothetical protein
LFDSFFFYLLIKLSKYNFHKLSKLISNWYPVIRNSENKQAANTVTLHYGLECYIVTHLESSPNPSPTLKTGKSSRGMTVEATGIMTALAT